MDEDGFASCKGILIEIEKYWLCCLKEWWSVKDIKCHSSFGIFFLKKFEINGFIYEKCKMLQFAPLFFETKNRSTTKKYMKFIYEKCKMLQFAPIFSETRKAFTTKKYMKVRNLVILYPLTKKCPFDRTLFSDMIRAKKYGF